MRRDLEIEDVRMRVMMEYEQEQGWPPEDLSGENYGCDVQSNRNGSLADIRYIQVKACPRTGANCLTANE